MTLGNVYDNFIRSRVLQDLTDKTLSAYRQFVTPFVRSVGADTEFSEIVQEDIEEYIYDLMQRPVSRSTKATYVRHLKAFLHWAETAYGANYSYRLVKVPKSPKKEVRIYTDAEVLAIFDAATAESEWLTLRNQTVIAMMYDSGLRQSEICSLKNKWVSSDNRMKVSGKGGKERVVPLGKITRRLLRQYKKACPYKSEYVFVGRRGEPMTCNAVKLMITKTASRLDFELSSHKLRHNFATNYCIDQLEKNHQVDIYSLMYLMGHEEIETTQRYLHFAYEIIASKNNISHLDNVIFA